jgi:glycosyltransferase involved in cell wall biosynthesis
VIGRSRESTAERRPAHSCSRDRLSSVTDSGRDRTVRVSVVIPVYNAGPYLDRSIGSMLSQTIPPRELEIIAVDDGSSDDSPARLDALAAGHPQLRVVHTPNSGWPGRPRNIGLDLARGTFVQLLDQDDWMPNDALERLSAMAAEQASDIVIGKVASDFRPVPRSVFRQTLPACTMWDAPLIDSLTPHKMFRASFLREHGLRFAEGRRRLEDQLFMVAAYFAAGRVSILADQTYYFYASRADHRNAGSQAIDPAGYYGNLREVLETVVATTQPGDDRNRFLRRFWRVEMLARCSEPLSLTYDGDYRHALFAAVRSLALDMIPEEVDQEFGPVLRARAALVRADRSDDMAELARRMDAIGLQAFADTVEWRAGKLVVALRLRFTDGGQPLTLRRSGDRLHLDAALTGGLSQPIPGSEPLPWRAEIAVRQPVTGEEWPLHQRQSLVELEPLGDDPSVVIPQLRVVATMDPLRIAGGAPLPRADWRLTARLLGPGFDRRGPAMVAATRSEAGTADPSRALLHSAPPALLGTPLHVAIPSRHEDGELGVDMDRAAISLGPTVALHGIGVPVQEGSGIEVPMPIHMRRGSEPMAVEVVLAGPAGTHAMAGTLAVRDIESERGVLTFEVPRSGTIAGRSQVSVRLDGGAGPAIPIGAVDVDPRGRVTLVSGRRAGRLAARGHQLRRFAKTTAWRVGRRLPAGLRRRLRRAFEAPGEHDRSP